MQLKHIAALVIILFIITAVGVWKAGQQQATRTSLLSTQINGPAVILFRGDNSPSCQVIHRLVDEAERLHNQITFRQLDWSPNHPLIEQYQVRFLPTVLLLDHNGKEVGRIIGESPAVQTKLKDTLARLDTLLLQ